MTKTLMSLTILIGVLAVADASPAAATDWRGVDRLQEGGLFQTPDGYRRLCDARPEFCADRNTEYEVSKVLADLARDGGFDRRRPSLTREALKQLDQVNRAVNRILTPRVEPDDEWSFSASVGDCEEYVLLKRETLASLGWPRAALRIAVGRTTSGVAHAVLIVKTEFEDVVLDNLRDDLVGVGAASHRFIATQSSLRPGRWVEVSRSFRRPTRI